MPKRAAAKPKISVRSRQSRAGRDGAGDRHAPRPAQRPPSPGPPDESSDQAQRTAPSRQSPEQAPVRLQKLLAGAGVASRRAAERLIIDGHVSVNGVIVRELGSAAVPGRDQIAVDGAPLRPPAAHSYFVLHKPPGYVSSLHDPHAERTVIDLLPSDAPRLYPVGRLDRESEGLLLLTDDGALTERLLHPRFGVEREYAALVKGDLSAGALAKLREGVIVEGAPVVPRSVIVTLPPATLHAASPPGTRWLRITLAEGRKREVRVMCAAVHLHVLRLIRVRFGPLALSDLPPGQCRPLTEPERLALLSPDTRASRPFRRDGRAGANAAATGWRARGTAEREGVSPSMAARRPRPFREPEPAPGRSLPLPQRSGATVPRWPGLELANERAIAKSVPVKPPAGVARASAAPSPPDTERRATERRSKRRAAGRAQRPSSKGKRSSEEASSN